MRIENFNQSRDDATITFHFIASGCKGNVEVKLTACGTSMTDISEFNLSDEEYSQLDDFVDACSGILHCFYHY